MRVLNGTILATSALALILATPALAADCEDRLAELESRSAAVELSAENRHEVEMRLEEARMLKAEGSEEACLTVAYGIEDKLAAADGPASAAAADAGAQTDAQAGSDQTGSDVGSAGAGAETRAETETQTEATTPGTGPGLAGNGLLEQTPSELIGETLKDVEGESIGTIRKVVAANGEAQAVVRSGGFLGLIGGTEVLVPLDLIETQGDDLVVTGVTSDEIENLPEFDSDVHRELPEEVTIGQSLQVMLR